MEDFSAVLRNKKFMYLWSSQVLSQLAINIMNFLVLINIYERTSSTIAASFIWIAYGVPAMLVGPFAAAAVDLYDRRKIMVISNALQAIFVLIYAVLYQKFVFISYGVVLAYSLMDQFYVPAESATLPVLVKDEDLPRANGLFFMSQQAAAMIGFGFAGILSELIGFGAAVMSGALLLFIAFLAVLRLPSQRRYVQGNSVETGVWHFFERIKEGYDFIRHKKSILYPFLFLMWMQVSLAILVVNMPAIGTEIVRTKPSLMGPIMIIPGGVGALFGTVMVSKMIQKVRKKTVVETALLSLFIIFVVVSLLMPLLPFWIGRLVLIFSFFGIGFFYVSALIPSLTFMQIQTPKKLMGRLFGNFWFLTTAATLIPVLFAATITEILGVTLLLVLLGCVAGMMFLFSKFKIKGNLTKI